MSTLELLAIASEFTLARFVNSTDLRVVRCEGYRLPVQPYMWKVMWGGNVLNKDGRWGLEPQPSSRTDEFYLSARFEERDDAFAAAWEAQPAVEAELARMYPRRAS